MGIRRSIHVRRPCLGSHPKNSRICPHWSLHTSRSRTDRLPRRLHTTAGSQLLASSVLCAQEEVVRLPTCPVAEAVPGQKGEFEVGRCPSGQKHLDAVQGSFLQLGFATSKLQRSGGLGTARRRSERHDEWVAQLIPGPRHHVPQAWGRHGIEIEFHCQLLRVHLLSTIALISWEVSLEIDLPVLGHLHGVVLLPGLSEQRSNKMRSLYVRPCMCVSSVHVKNILI